MSFFSTRGGAAVTASQAILYGLAPDGGLYVPAMFPPTSLQKIGKLADMDYRQRACAILKTYRLPMTRRSLTIPPLPR